ncbi:YadA C-terminal domain-containing protein [Vibrio amylolyticus]|uniref:YadA C-terminal domain-containing protein n=1 Tax=Vibrio amylolyticus TaxID=2847292 RepID=UPI0035503EDF
MKNVSVALTLLSLISTPTVLANSGDDIVDGVLDCAMSPTQCVNDVARAGSNISAEDSGWQAARRADSNANQFFDGNSTKEQRDQAAINYLDATTNEDGSDKGAQNGMDQVVTKINDNNAQTAHDHMRMDGLKALAKREEAAGRHDNAKALNDEADKIYQRSIEDRKKLGNDFNDVDAVRKHNESARVEQDRNAGKTIDAINSDSTLRAINEQESFNQNIEGRVNNLENAFQQQATRINENEGKMSNGIAGVAAMANMPLVPGATTIGAGVGHFNGSDALAIGVTSSFGETNQWSVKASGSYAEGKYKQKDFVVGAGVGYSF